MKFAFIFTFLLLSAAVQVRAQTDKTATDTAKPAKKPLLLTFGIDIKFKSIAGNYLHDYTGEYNSVNPGDAGWRWVNHKTDVNTVLNKASFSDIRLSVLGGGNQTFQFGLSFNFGSINDTIKEPNYDQLTYPGQKTMDVVHYFQYAGISLAMEYRYFFNKKTYLGPYAYAGLDLGFYTGSDDIFGPGTPFYTQGKLGFGWNIKKDIMVKLYAATDQLIYHETETSQVFHKPETLDINLGTWYVGVGFSKTFTLIPD